MPNWGARVVLACRVGLLSALAKLAYDTKGHRTMFAICTFALGIATTILGFGLWQHNYDLLFTGGFILFCSLAFAAATYETGNDLP